jgi:hypothetical protein
MQQVAMTRIIALALTLIPLGPGAAVGADEVPAESGRERVYTVGSAVGTMLYTPLKGVLCFTGGIASGFAFLSSGGTAAKAVASASCKGKWILTPGVLRGTQPFEFVGEIDQTPNR